MTLCKDVPQQMASTQAARPETELPAAVGKPDGNLSENPTGATLGKKNKTKTTVCCCFPFGATKLQESARDGWLKLLAGSVEQPSSLSDLCTQSHAHGDRSEIHPTQENESGKTKTV